MSQRMKFLIAAVVIGNVAAIIVLFWLVLDMRADGDGAIRPNTATSGYRSSGDLATFAAGGTMRALERRLACLERGAKDVNCF